MTSLSKRKISGDDYLIIKGRLSRLIDKLAARGTKALYRHLDLEQAMIGLYQLEHVYIVSGYLVAYHIGSPWYSNSTFLSEALVLRLNGNSPFRVCTDFLQAEAREAGAVMAIAGTALAPADYALASLYQLAGFSVEALTLTKEI